MEFILHIKRERERERERERDLKTYQLKFAVHIDDNFNTQINLSPPILPCVLPYVVVLFVTFENFLRGWNAQSKARRV